MGRYQGIELDDVELAGPRVTLRRWQPEDAARVFEIMQDRSMHEFLALPDPYTESDAGHFVTEVGDEGRGDGHGVGSAVVERDTGRLVGAGVLRLRGDPDIGYWTAPDARGRGYATEITRVLAEFGFTLGLPRVRLACDVRNLASIRTALGAGFAFEGVSRAGAAGGGGEETPARNGDLARFARLPADPGDPVSYAFPPLPAAGLRDDALALRTLDAGDAAELAEADDGLARQVGFGGPAPDYERASARAGLDWLVGGGARFAMIDLATGALAGSLDLRHAGPPRIGGIGYLVHPLFRGRGYTTRALRLLVPWAFDVADLGRLELGAKVSNVASQRAARSAGFEPDGIRRSRLLGPDGSFSDEARFALVNPRYAPRRISP